ncbi:extracellular catalytic domain type 1 short-chain-length polyhydroxyalkanoate depolymerase [Actinospica robiniae]|uniref:extracellular catalytic domain type 1 short-chain-length polyhydroxyalkanoate depolymerase n=1 Tax=Actinospica robiniae TaxID=304901 RepID=UPI00055228EE|nr:PHB depolymerase family esterase [Actinospica robiniae]
MKHRLRALGAALTAAVTAAATITAVVASAPTAAAASLVQVTNFGTNPTNLLMYEYVPNNVSAHPAILLALHQCTGTGPGFYSGTAFASLADQYGFIVIYPTANRSGNCWDVSSSAALSHTGNSDPAGLMSMITYVEQHNNGDSSRVYVTGASSGAMMTNVMLGDYPNVFQAGSAFMGVPFGCFYTGTVDGWNSACANGQSTMTGAQWAQQVYNAYPGYSGARPRMQLWHGTADTTLNYNNFGQEILQWTTVLGVSSTPTTTDSPAANWTRTRYDNGSGTIEVEAYSIAGQGHVLPIEGQGMEQDAIHFFGLDGSSTGGNPSPSPSHSASPSPSATSASPSSGPTTGGGGSGACKVTDTISAWNTGETENLTVTNNGAAINGWTLKFTLASGQVITQGWNATFTGTSGAVSATNLSYNGSIPAGGTVTLGFNANQTGNSAAPTGFTLNGAACSVG